MMHWAVVISTDFSYSSLLSLSRVAPLSCSNICAASDSDNMCNRLPMASCTTALRPRARQPQSLQQSKIALVERVTDDRRATDVCIDDGELGLIVRDAILTVKVGIASIEQLIHEGACPG